MSFQKIVLSAQITLWSAAIALSIYLALPFAAVAYWLMLPERTGIVNFDNCRQVEILDPNPFARIHIREIFFKDFICDREGANESARVCRLAITENGVCTHAYIYTN